MTAEVVQWDETLGRGVARVTWPKGLGFVTLLRSGFRGRGLRLGQERIGLQPGDGIQFAAIGGGNIARRISRSQFTLDQPAHAYQRPEGPSLTVTVTVRPADPEEAAYYHGEDLEEP